MRQFYNEFGQLVDESDNPVQDDAKATNTPINISDELQRLSMLNPIEYDQVREDEAKRLNVRVSVLDKEVSIKRESSGEPLKGRALEFYIPEPWCESVGGSLVLDEAYNSIKRHMAISDEYAATAVLWAAHVYVFDLFSHTPRLCISAPDAECGKTVLLSHMVGNLIPKPQHTENISPAPFFRLAELHRPSFLIDEADVFFRQDSDLIGAINGGWEPHGGVIRCIGDDHEPRHFSTHCPVAIGGIRLEKILPATTISRAIMIPLQRAMPDEIAEIYDSKKHLPGLRDIGRKLARWCQDNRTLIAEYEPTMPDKAINRRADKWRPLFTMAQVAGGHWPQRAISAFIAEERDDSKKMSTSQQLLSDIREVIKPHENHIATDELITRICNLDESIWDGYNFKERDTERRRVQPRQLSELLRGYKVKPTTVRIGGYTPKGYKVTELSHAFKRYLSPTLSATPPQPAPAVACSDSLSATRNKYVADEKPLEPAPSVECGGVADKSTLNPDFDKEGLKNRRHF